MAFGDYLNTTLSGKPAKTSGRRIAVMIAIAIPLFIITFIAVMPKVPDKPQSPPTDFTRPLFTRKFTAACPISILDDHREGLGMKAANDAIVTGIGMEKALHDAGCEMWRSGIPVFLPAKFAPARDGLVHWLPVYENPNFIGVPTLIPDADLTN